VKKAFLVVQRHNLDDLPLLLTLSEQVAMERAENLSWVEVAAEQAQHVLHLDATTPQTTAVFGFDETGKFVEATTVHDYTDPEAQA